MEELPRERFDALMGSTRNQMARIVGTEVAWYSDGDERVLGVIVQDQMDRDYACIVLARDRIGRFRSVHLSEWVPTIAEAAAATRILLRDWGARDGKDYEHGDEPPHALNFFSPCHKRERLNPDFVRLIDSEELSPAWGVIESLMFYFRDPDGNFVEQFQSTAFYPRIWELYLFAVLAEDRCEIDRANPAPDYLFSGMFGPGFIEAVTVNPSKAGEPGYPQDPSLLSEYLANYLPIKFAGPLTAKLQRRYWDEPHIGGRPIVFAIADYHCPDSMGRSQLSLCSYLYGFTFDSQLFDGRLLLRAQTRVQEHVWGRKRVPSGFFDQPGAENISAVISTGEDTMMKFNRMGRRAGFGSSRLAMRASGVCIADHPCRTAPKQFEMDISSPEYQELWIDGLQIYHNPRATQSLDPRLFGDATHHLVVDGNFEGVYVDSTKLRVRTHVSVRT